MASEKDRQHFDVVARAMAEKEREAERSAAALDPAERMRRGFRLAEPFRHAHPELTAELEAEAWRGKMELHRRWRRLHGQP